MVSRKDILFFAAILACIMTTQCQAQYTTDWIANTYGLNTTRVGNGARSMWVDPTGIIYTASMWDENAGSIGIYQNHATLGTIGSHNDTQGGAITGNSTDVFAALQYTTTYGSGQVGRYIRSSKTRDLIIAVSADTTETKADVITGLATSGTLLYASDYPGNRVRIFTTAGVWQRDISVTSPGALAVDSAGDIWVAQMASGTILEFSSTGTALNTITLATTARPSALYYDQPNSQLYIGDQGPDMDIKIYNISGTPVLASTFGTLGGYLDSTHAIKGIVGDKRFTRVVGIGKDSSGNLYVLNNPWGGSWDLGRNGATDIHAYNSSGTLLWMLQGLNFEAAASPDPTRSGGWFYSGNNIYDGTAGGTFLASTIDAITYPTDQRILTSDASRGEFYGQLATLGGRHFLAVGSQNPDIFYFYHFSPTSGYTAIEDSSIPGTEFGTTARVRGGFCFDANGDVWAGLGTATSITHYTLASFDSNDKPTWSAGVNTATPTSIGTLVRIVYVAATDTMILASGITGSTDWTSIGTRVEVYNGWKAGNTTTPNTVITLTKANPKSLAAAGNYLFVGYAATTPDVDAFNLTTGALDMTLANTNTANVYLGNDVDSMYGVRAYENATTGEYIVTRDNYNGVNLIVWHWTP